MSNKFYTVKDVVAKRGCSVRRANKLVNDLKIGKMVGQTRILDAEEFKLVTGLPDRRTKKFKNSRKRP